jgi:hypothetical protein
MGKVKEVLPGLSAAGRSKTYKRRGLWALKKKNGGKFPVHPKKAAKAAVDAKVGKWKKRGLEECSAFVVGAFFCFSLRPGDGTISICFSLLEGKGRQRACREGAAPPPRETRKKMMIVDRRSAAAAGSVISLSLSLFPAHFTSTSTSSSLLFAFSPLALASVRDT